MERAIANPVAAIVRFFIGISSSASRTLVMSVGRSVRLSSFDDPNLGRGRTALETSNSYGRVALFWGVEINLGP